MIFKRRVDPVRETLVAIYKSNQGISRLDSLLDKLSSRRDKLLEYAITLENRGEKFLANKYVEEAKRIEDLHNRLSDLKLVLMKITMGLEKVLVTHDFRGLANELVTILGDVKKLPEASLPEINSIVVEVESSIAKLKDFSYTLDDLSFSVVNDDEVNKILCEAREIIKNKLKLPEPPKNTS